MPRGCTTFWRRATRRGFEAPLRALLAGIPHDWHRRNEIARYEGYWASVFYAHFAALGLDVAAEDATSRGRLDLAVRLGAHVYLFEFKVAGPSGRPPPAGAGGAPGRAPRAEDGRGAGPTEGARLRRQVPRPGARGSPESAWRFGAESRDIVAFETEPAMTPGRGGAAGSRYRESR